MLAAKHVHQLDPGVIFTQPPLFKLIVVDKFQSKTSCPFGQVRILQA